VEDLLPPPPPQARAKPNHSINDSFNVHNNAPSCTEVLCAHYALSLISTAPRTAVSASSQMEHFRQACDAQQQRPLWQLQQANYGGCVFAVRFRSFLVSAISPRHLCSMLPLQRALAHP